MSVSLKYAVVERERRWLVRRIPEGVSSTKDIVDRYVTGTRLRLREVREADGTVVRKLGQKVRLSDGPAEVACTNSTSTTPSGPSWPRCRAGCCASGAT